VVRVKTDLIVSSNKLMHNLGKRTHDRVLPGRLSGLADSNFYRSHVIL